MEAGDHAAYGLEGAGVTGEVTVHKRTGIPSMIGRELEGRARITKELFTLKIFKIIEKFGFYRLFKNRFLSHFFKFR